MIKKQHYESLKAIFIDMIEKDALEYTRAVKAILRSLFWSKRCGIQVRLVTK